MPIMYNFEPKDMKAYAKHMREKQLIDIIQKCTLNRGKPKFLNLLRVYNNLSEGRQCNSLVDILEKLLMEGAKRVVPFLQPKMVATETEQEVVDGAFEELFGLLLTMSGPHYIATVSPERLSSKFASQCCQVSHSSIQAVKWSDGKEDIVSLHESSRMLNRRDPVKLLVGFAQVLGTGYAPKFIVRFSGKMSDLLCCSQSPECLRVQVVQVWSAFIQRLAEYAISLNAEQLATSADQLETLSIDTILSEVVKFYRRLQEAKESALESRLSSKSATSFLVMLFDSLLSSDCTVVDAVRVQAEGMLQQLLPLLWIEVASALQSHIQAKALDHLNKEDFDRFEKDVTFLLTLNSDCLILRDREDQIQDKFFVTFAQKDRPGCVQVVSLLFRAEVQRRPKAFFELFRSAALQFDLDKQLTTTFFELLAAVEVCNPVKSLALIDEKAFSETSDVIIMLLRTFETWNCLEGLEVLLTLLLKVLGCSNLVLLNLGTEDNIRILSSLLKHSRTLVSTNIITIIANSEDDRQKLLEVALCDGGMTVNDIVACPISDRTFQEVLAVTMSCHVPRESSRLVGEKLIQTLVANFDESDAVTVECREKLSVLVQVLSDEKDGSGTSRGENDNTQLEYLVRNALKPVCHILTNCAARKLSLRSQGESEVDSALALRLLFRCVHVEERRAVACLSRIFPTVPLTNFRFSGADTMDITSQGLISEDNRFIELVMTTPVTSSVTSYRATQTVTDNDFVDMREIVRKEKKEAESLHREVILPHPTKTTMPCDVAKVKIANEVFEAIPVPAGFEDQVPKTSLVSVDSTKRNIRLILKSQEAGFPLLIEGETGVGKSAAVMEAARLLDRPLIRFNLSSSVTCGDIIGRVSLSSSEQSSLLSYQKGPFTVAFENGLWLLLDELNLASDDILQVIESAIDTGMLCIDSLSEHSTSLVLKRHEHFRLFATQNPHTGSFKGTRTALSAAFVSRFQTVCFQPPNTDELETIVSRQLHSATVRLNGAVANANIKDWPRRMVTAHQRLVEKVLPKLEGEKDQPYAETTVRDLMKWTTGVKSAIAEIVSNQRALDAINDDMLNQLYLFEGQCVYETRFLSDISRKEINRGLASTVDSSASSLTDKTITSLELRTGNGSDELVLGQHVVYNQFDGGRLQFYQKGMLQFHRKLTYHIMNESGGLMYCPFLVPEWHAIVESTDSPPVVSIIRAGFRLYARYLPKCFHDDLKQMLNELMTQHWNVLNVTVTFESVRPDAVSPFVVTSYVKKIWMYILHALKHRQPVLVVGPEGCGKSELILWLGCLLGKQVNTWCMTADTEASDLVGKVVPKKPAAWEDGVVTQCVTKGEWLLLDNVTEAEPTVLERLNPLLEKDAMWVLTEKGETKNLLDQFGDEHDFRFLATATVSSNSDQLKISPAMANRLTIVSITDYAFTEGCFMDISALLLYHDHPTTILNKHESSCQEINILKALEKFFSRVRREGLQFSKCFLVTLRTLARIILGAHRVHQRFSDSCSISQAIVTACDMCILQQLQEKQRQVLKGPDGPWEELKAALACVDHVYKLQLYNFLTADILEKEDFVLDREKTPERCSYANMILFAYYTKLPVLLEGPAATGKTSLVEFIGKCLKRDDASILYKTINSESTSIQDYFGTFIPCGDGNFADLQGPLTTAIRHGAFFLADEFNLAEPSVLNALFPLLEGRKCICNPVSGKPLTVMDGFLFFATQNNALYADRKQLPQSLRNRFLQAQVGDFAEGELAFILKSRKFSSQVLFKSSKDTELLEKASKAIDEAVQRSGVLFGTKATTKMTIRDLIKWVERFISLGQSTMIDGRPVSWAAAGLTMLVPKLKPMPSIQKSVSVILTAMKTAGLVDISDDLQSATCTFVNEELILSDGVVSLQAKFPGDIRAVSEMNNPENYLRAFAQVHISLKCHEPVLLIGPTTFKTKLVRDYLCGCTDKGLDNMFVVQLSSDTQVGDIIGQIHPFRFHAALGELIKIAKQLFERLRLHDVNSSALEEAGELLDSCREKWRNRANVVVESASAAIDPIQMLDEEEIHVSEHREAITSQLVRSRSEDHSCVIESEAESVEDDLNDDIRGYFGECVEETAIEDSYQMDDNEVLLTPVDEKPVGSVADETAFEGSENGQYFLHTGLATNNYAKTSRIEKEQVSIPVSSSNVTEDEYVDDDTDDYAPIEYFPDDTTNYVNYEGEIAKSAPQISRDFASDDDVDDTDDYASFEYFPDAGTDSVDETRYLQEETAKKFEFQDDFDNVLCRLESLTAALSDETVSFLLRKYTTTLGHLKKASTNINRPVFLFRDGSVTRAVKEGKSIIFEDINLPSQAVVERLNSLFESGRILYVSEDVSALNDPSSTDTSHHRGNNGIQMVDDAQILATVHVDNLSENVNLSPALRSRFSEILVPQLSLDDIGMVCENRCLNTTGLKTYAGKVRTAMLSVQEKLFNGGLGYFTLKEAMTWITVMDGLDVSLRRAGAAVSWMDLFLVAGRLVLLDSVPPERKDVVRAALLGILELFVKDFEEIKKAAVSKEVRNWIENIGGFASDDITDMITVANGYIKVKQLPIAAAASQTVLGQLNDEFLQERFQFTTTKTSMDNVIRILASLASDSALLLEGPPGIGKTSIVEQTARLLGFEVERISFTKDTSADVLIGSYIPRAEKSTGEMVFTWQGGRVLEAYTGGRFLLLDEINLASQEVLDELKTIIDSTVSQYTVRGLDQTVDRHPEFRVFATMNPTSVGGGRAKLPQSVESLFVKVHLQEYSLEEEAHICVDQFDAKGLIGDDGLNKEDLRNLVQLHRDVKEMVDRKEIGKQGGPYELNVRDLLKMRDVLYGNIFSLRSHLELNEDERQSKAARQTFVNDNARIAALRTASELVYSKRFSSIEDQRKVITAVDKLFPSAGIADHIVHDVTIDVNLPNSVQIGFVYLTKGHEESPFTPLLSTTTLNQQLQLLASAVVSGRVVFLQGPTCSRKTSLVVNYRVYVVANFMLYR